MSAAEVLGQLYERGVILQLDGRQLRYRAPKGVMTEGLKKLITEHKEEIINHLEEERNHSILCPYKGIERPVHPEVCKWHREENDPECECCDPDRRRVLH